MLIQQGRNLQKVSALAVLAVPPRRDGVRQLAQNLHPHAGIRTPQIIDFLRHLNHELKGPCLLIWDRLNAHRAKRTAQFIARLLPACFLPARLRPELNPVEYAWGYLKMNPLANGRLPNRGVGHHDPSVHPRPTEERTAAAFLSPPQPLFFCA